MTTTQDPIAHASRLLRETAEELRQAHAFPGIEGWENETDAKPAYDEHMAAAQALEDWEAAVGAGGVQALSAAPAGWKLVPVDPSVDQEWKDKEASLRADFMAEACKIYKAMLAASPTPPAEQQAKDSYIKLLADCRDAFPVPEHGSPIENEWIAAVGSHEAVPAYLQAVAKQQAAPKAAPVVWLSSKQLRGVTALHGQYLPFRCQPEGRFDTPVYLAEAAPKAAPGVGNSGFDHQTAADFLSGKTVSDESVRKFVQASRWAHDEKASLSAMLLSVRGELASREAEIALLKKALMEAEAAPKQEAREPVSPRHPVVMQWRDNAIEACAKIADAYGHEHAAQDMRAMLTAPQQEAQEPYPIDADPQGIRAVVADAITGALAFGAQGSSPPPEGHWLTPFWEMAREEAMRIRPASVSRDTLNLLRRLLSNQHTLTGSEFRAELEKIVGEAYQQEAQEPATVPYQKLTNEIDLILSDPDTELSTGAKRALLWVRTWVSVPLYTAPQPAPAPLSDDAKDVVRDAAFEAVRKKLCALPRFSFLSDGYGVRRVPDKSGSWIAFDAAHELFDPVAVDAALAAQGGK